MIEFFAGVIDSRAHISMVSRHGKDSPRVRVTTKRIEILTWLGQQTDVTPHVDGRGYDRRGCTEHCQERHIHLIRNSAYWNVDGRRAMIVLYNVLPHLVAQKEIAFLALQAGEWPTRQTRTEITEKMRRLGWEIPRYADLPRQVPMRKAAINGQRQISDYN